jgi:hypothetical protein
MPIPEHECTTKIFPTAEPREAICIKGFDSAPGALLISFFHCSCGSAATRKAEGSLKKKSKAGLPEETDMATKDNSNAKSSAGRHPRKARKPGKCTTENRLKEAVNTGLDRRESGPEGVVVEPCRLVCAIRELIENLPCRCERGLFNQTEIPDTAKPSSGHERRKKAHGEKNEAGLESEKSRKRP